MDTCIDQRSMDGVYNLSIAPNMMRQQLPANDEFAIQLSTQESVAPVSSALQASKQYATLQLSQCHLAFLNAVVDQPVQQWSDLFEVRDQAAVYNALMLADVFLAQSLRIQAYAMARKTCEQTLFSCQQLLEAALTNKTSISLALWHCRKKLSRLAINRLQVKPKVAAALSKGDSLDSFVQLLQHRGAEVLLQSASGLYLEEQALGKVAHFKLKRKFNYFASLLAYQQYSMMLTNQSDFHVFFDQSPADDGLLSAVLNKAQQQAQAEFDQALANCGLDAVTVKRVFIQLPKLNKPLHHSDALVACTAANAVHEMLV